MLFLVRKDIQYSLKNSFLEIHLSAFLQRVREEDGHSLYTVNGTLLNIFYIFRLCFMYGLNKQDITC